MSMPAPGDSPSVADRAVWESPADNHVHSQWSWDTQSGDMVRTCERARELGLPAIAFTEHLDLTRWTLPPTVTLPAEWSSFIHDDTMQAPMLDVSGYLASVAECRERFPNLRILSGLEISEPHWHRDEVTALIATGEFERLLASQHSGPLLSGAGMMEFSALYLDRTPREVVDLYLAQILDLVTQSDHFEVLAHIDYPVRYWPSDGPEFDPRDFSDGFHAVLEALAASGRALECNTRVPLAFEILSWWHDVGGTAITFASDAHHPDALALGFRAATDLATAAGFRAGTDPIAFWGRA